MALDSHDIERFLQEQKVNARLLRLGRPTRTVEEAAAALNVTPRQIVKSLLFQGEGGQVVLVVLRGDQRVSRTLLTLVTGMKHVTLASPEQVLKVTGYPAGATPPFAHATPIHVIVDPGVLEEGLVFAGGGDEDTLIEIAPETLVQLAQATVTSIAR